MWAGSIKNTSGDLCTLTWYRDKLKDSWKQEVRNISEDEQEVRCSTSDISVCPRKGVKQADWRPFKVCTLISYHRGGAEKPRALTRAWPECVQLNSMPTLSSVVAVQLSTSRSPTHSLACVGVRLSSWILYPAEKGGRTWESANGLLFSWDYRLSLHLLSLLSPTFTHYQSLCLYSCWFVAWIFILPTTATM